LGVHHQEESKIPFSQAKEGSKRIGGKKLRLRQRVEKEISLVGLEKANRGQWADARKKRLHPKVRFKRVRGKEPLKTFGSQGTLRKERENLNHLCEKRHVVGGLLFHVKRGRNEAQSLREKKGKKHFNVRAKGNNKCKTHYKRSKRGR